MLKSIRRLICSGSLLLLTAIIYLLARFLPQVWFSFYPQVSKTVLSAIGAVTGIFPFCVWEIFVVLLLLWGIVSLVLSLKSKRIVRWLTGVLELVTLLLFLFVATWGLNHFGPTAAEKLEISVEAYSVEELQSATVYYASMASKYAEEVPRNSDNSVQTPSFRELSEQAVSTINAMPQPLFQDAAKTVKPLLSSRLFSHMGVTGIFIDITAEPCVNTQTFPVSMPYTICHELSHSCAVAAEDDANYCAYLICEQSDSLLFRYSGYYSAYIYCYNALYKKDVNAAGTIYNSNSELLKADCRAAVAYYDQFDGPVQETATKVNDTYLKTFGEETGVQSYGAVVDLLVSHWQMLQEG